MLFSGSLKVLIEPLMLLLFVEAKYGWYMIYERTLSSPPAASCELVVGPHSLHWAPRLLAALVRSFLSSWQATSQATKLAS